MTHGGPEDAEEAARERGRRDAAEQIERHAAGAPRQAAAASVLATVIGKLNLGGADKLVRAYVEGVTEIVENELRNGNSEPDA